MKNRSISKEIKFIDEYYKITKYFGSNIIEIEELVPNGFFGKHDMVYKRIYFGNLEPLEEAIKFFKNN